MLYRPTSTRDEIEDNEEGLERPSRQQRGWTWRACGGLGAEWERDDGWWAVALWRPAFAHALRTGRGVGLVCAPLAGAGARACADAWTAAWGVGSRGEVAISQHIKLLTKV